MIEENKSINEGPYISAFKEAWKALKRDESDPEFRAALFGYALAHENRRAEIMAYDRKHQTTIATMRDQFAMHAMNGLISSSELHLGGSEPDNERLAACSYIIADAMMAARGQR